jgi:hypothetical protein
MRNIRPLVVALIGAAAIAASISCGDVVRGDRTASILVINSLGGAPGNKPAAFGAPLESDVTTNLTSPAPCSAASPCPTIFNDLGQVVLSLAPKDVSLTPTSNNQVTISRYHVEYVRTDGRNTQGVDVPYAVDGAMTGTISTSGSATMSFELVQNVAKEQTPLVQLVSGGFINTIAKVTFYGRDIVGNDVSVSGQIQINFANFADQ